METRFITVQLLGSGYAAVCFWLNNEDLPEPFWEPFDTGFGRYQTTEEAENEAAYWAECEGFPLLLKGDEIIAHTARCTTFPYSWQHIQRRVHAITG